MNNRRIPRQVVIEVTSRCNLMCLGCPYTTDVSQGHMSFDFFKSIVDRIDFDTTVVAWLNGEPLLHPRYGEMVDYLIRKGKRFYTTTNGHIWRNDFFERVMDPDSTCYQVLFSLDGLPDPESKSIELARPGSNRAVVLGNIHRAMNLKIARRSPIDIAVKLCERGQDPEEVEQYISYWLNMGINYVCIGKLLENENVPDGMRMFPCRYFDDMAMEIRWDGRLVPCSYHDKVMNQGYLSMGVLDFETPLLDAYNNSNYQALRTAHHERKFPYPCDTCGFAYCGDGFEGVVYFRNEALGTRPMYTHSDYYNTFYSYERKRQGISWSKGSSNQMGLFDPST